MTPDERPSFDHLSDFDRAGALARLGDDPDLLAELIELFAEQRDSLWARLDAAVNAGDPAAVERAAHALKGALMTLAADRSVAIARAIEHGGRQGRLDHVADLRGALRDALDRFADQATEAVAA